MANEITKKDEELFNLFKNTGCGIIPCNKEPFRVEKKVPGYKIGDKNLEGVFPGGFPKYKDKRYNDKRHNESGDVTHNFAVFTGPEHNLLALDCDNEYSYKYFKRHLPKHIAIAVSKRKRDKETGVIIEAGTFLFTYTKELEWVKGNFEVKEGGHNFEVLAEKQILAPCRGNHTKESWTYSLDEIPKEIPPADSFVISRLQYYLEDTYKAYVTSKSKKKTSKKDTKLDTQDLNNLANANRTPVKGRLRDYALKYLGLEEEDKIFKVLGEMWEMGQKHTNPNEKKEFVLKEHIHKIVAKGDTHDKDRFYELITPRSLKETKHPAVMEKGFLRPNELRDGEGSKYFASVSAKLGGDLSISEELYEALIYALNKEWGDPMSIKKLKDSIINPMVKGKSTWPSGEVIWKYDENWVSYGLFYPNKVGDEIEMYLDKDTDKFVFVNHTNTNEDGEIEQITQREESVRKAREKIKKGTGFAIPEKEFLNRYRLLKTIYNPLEPYGSNLATDTYNLYKRTEAMEVFLNPAEYKPNYSTPTLYLDYFKCLIPCDVSREFVFKFLKRKFLKFDYSEVILYFWGASGSGKDTFLNVLEHLVGDIFIKNIKPEHLLSEFNSFIKNCFFFHFSELAHIPKKKQDQILGEIKGISGSKKRSVQIKYIDELLKVNNKATAVISENEQSFKIEKDDRRTLPINTPNKLQEQGFYKKAQEEWGEGDDGFPIGLRRQAKDFAYYLRVKVKDFDAKKDFCNGKPFNYHFPPETKEKIKLRQSSQTALEEIADLIKNNSYEEFTLECLDKNVGQYEFHKKYGRVLVSALHHLYDAKTQYKENMTEDELRKKLDKDHGIKFAKAFKYPNKKDQEKNNNHSMFWFCVWSKGWKDYKLDYNEIEKKMNEEHKEATEEQPQEEPKEVPKEKPKEAPKEKPKGFPKNPPKEGVKKIFGAVQDQLDARSEGKKKSLKSSKKEGK